MTSFAFASQNTFLRAPALAAGHRFGIAGLADKKQQRHIIIPKDGQRT